LQQRDRDSKKRDLQQRDRDSKKRDLQNVKYVHQKQ